jgi:hypothetical protein
MSALRYIDGNGRERVIDDVSHLFELIKSRQIQGSSLIWDEGESRWIGARDHEFFRRIREIAADSDAPKPSATAAESPAAHVYGASRTASKPVASETLNNKEVAAAETAARWAAHRPVTSEALNSKEPSQAPRESGTNPASKPKSRWFKPIKNREEALKTIKGTSIVFFAIAGIQAIIGLAVTQYSSFDFNVIVIDAGLFAALASWLRWGRSRFAAVFLLLNALIALGATTGNKLEISNIGGKNIWLALIVFWAACKAVEATFKLPGFEKASAREEYQPFAVHSKPVAATRNAPDILRPPLHRGGPGEPAFLLSITRSEQGDTARFRDDALTRARTRAAWFFVIALFVIFAIIVMLALMPRG